MRKVKFIESLNIKEVPCMNKEHLQYHVINPAWTSFIGEGSEALCLDEEPTCRTVLIHHLCKHHRPPFKDPGKLSETEEIYIAYSKEVQDLIELPFDLISEQLSFYKRKNSELSGEVIRLEGILMKIKQLSFYQRVKALFKGFV